MDGKETIKAKINQAKRDIENNIRKDTADMQKLESGLSIAITLYNTALRFSKGDSEVISHIEILQNAFEQWYRDYKNAKCKNMAEWVEDVKPVINIIRAYYELMDNIGDSTQSNALPELTKEEIEILKKVETDKAFLSDDPFLRVVTQKNINIANYGEPGRINILERTGDLTPYHAAVFDTAIKAYKVGKVTKDGYIMLSENQAIKTLLGTTGTPSQKQKDDFLQAWKDMQNARIRYETTADFSKMLGFDESELQAAFKNVDQTETDITNDPALVRDFRVRENRKIDGKPTNIYYIQPSKIMKYVLDRFDWYEQIPQDIQRVEYIDKNGAKKALVMSNQRITLRRYIYLWVYKRIRARADGKMQYSLLLPYKDIFADCGIDISHRQEKARRLDDIRIILDHLQTEKVIASWNQYYVQDGKVLQGVEVHLFKEEI